MAPTTTIDMTGVPVTMATVWLDRPTRPNAPRYWRLTLKRGTSFVEVVELDNENHMDLPDALTAAEVHVGRVAWSLTSKTSAKATP